MGTPYLQEDDPKTKRSKTFVDWLLTSLVEGGGGDLANYYGSHGTGKQW